MPDDNLSDKSEEIRDIHHSTGWSKIYHEKDVHAAVLKLKEGCLICGKPIILKSRPNKSGFCDSCRNDINNYSSLHLRDKIIKKITKIFGSQLSEPERRGK